MFKGATWPRGAGYAGDEETLSRTCGPRLEAILASASSLTPAELESVIKSMRAAQDS